MAYDLTGLIEFINEDKHRNNIYTKAVNGNDSAPWLNNLGMFKNDMKLPNLDVERGVLQDGDLELTAAKFNGDVTITQTTLVVESIAYFTKLNARNLETFYTNLNLSMGQYYDESDISAPDQALLSKITDTIAGDMECLIWEGDKVGGAGFLALADGFIKQDETAVIATSLSKTSSGVITDANAKDIIEGLVDAAMADKSFSMLLNEPKMTYVLTGHDVVRNYSKQYRADHGALEYNTEFNKPIIDGTACMLIGVSGLTGQDAVFLTRTDNFHRGHDIIGEQEALRIGMDQFDEFVWVKNRMKHGVVARDMGDASVFYHSATA